MMSPIRLILIRKVNGFRFLGIPSMSCLKMMYVSVFKACVHSADHIREGLPKSRSIGWTKDLNHEMNGLAHTNFSIRD